MVLYIYSNTSTICGILTLVNIETDTLNWMSFLIKTKLFISLKQTFFKGIAELTGKLEICGSQKTKAKKIKQKNKVKYVSWNGSWY